MNFDYFYNRQSEMYNFIRLPMVLMEDEIFESSPFSIYANDLPIFDSFLIFGTMKTPIVLLCPLKESPLLSSLKGED